jgi:predicted nucleic acid-binding protein
MIVADTNLIAQLILSLDQTRQAQEIYRLDRDWKMPRLWQHEFLNLLASYLRFDEVPVAILLTAWDRALRLFESSSSDVDMPQALQLAGERDISAYDAQYVALARALGVPLITEDRKLLRAAPCEALSMKQYLSTRRRS